MKERTNVSSIMYSLMIVLPIVGDSILSRWMGAFGLSVMPALSTVLIIPYAVMNRDVFYCDRRLKYLIALLLLLVVVNVLTDSIWLLTGGELIIRGENVCIKSAKGVLTFSAIIFYLLIVSNLSEGISEEQAFRPFAIALVILALIAFIELFTMPNALPWAHEAGGFPYWRVRLLTIESSTTAPQIIIYGGLSLYYAWEILKNRKLTVACVLLLGFLTFSSSSKTLMVCILIIPAIVFVHYILHNKSRIKLLAEIAVALIPIAYVLVDRLSEAMQMDLARYTSITTRVYMGLIGIRYAAMYPFGTGSALYLKLYPDMLIERLGLIKSLRLGNASEIMRLAKDSASDYGLSTKSGITQYGLYWGLVGSCVFLTGMIKTYNEAYKKTGSVILLSVCILAMLTLCFTNDFDHQYEYWALFSGALYILKDPAVEE